MTLSRWFAVSLVLGVAGCNGAASPTAVGARVGHSLDTASVTTGDAVGHAGYVTGSALERAGNSVARATSP